MFVYLITNSINGKKYVGQHSGNDLDKYWSHCVAHALRGSSDKPYLYNAVRKYRPENLCIKPLVIVGTKWEMDLYEKGMIKALNTRKPFGYNITEGGDGVLGLRHSEESNQKNREAHLGRKDSPETIEKKRAVWVGRKHTEETKLKMSLHVKSEEHRKKISIAKMGNTARLGMKNTTHSRRPRSVEVRLKMSEAQKRRRERERQDDGNTVGRR
jgi:group I intron endonuclease